MERSLKFILVVLCATVCTHCIRAASLGTGGYTNSFSSLPPAVDWSTFSISGGAGDISAPAGMDAAVQLFAASSANAQLTLDAANPPAFLANGTWSSSGLYVQTRPTGNAATLVMATFLNTLGQNGASVTLSYDYVQAAVNADGEQVDGHRVYYSTNGQPGSWTPIPSLSSPAQGRPSATLNFTWNSGGTLYVIWVDDNATPASPDTAMQIDNFSATVTPAAQVPASITSDPQSISVNELSPASFTVGVGGNPTPTIQWYSNDVAIPGATGGSYNIASTPLHFNGLQLKAVAQNTANSTTYTVTSAVATLTVIADTNPPVLVGALASGLSQVVAWFSERLAASSVTNIANYSITSLQGSLTIQSAALDGTLTNVLINVSTMTTGALYTLTVNGPTDQSAAANVVAPNSQAQFSAAALTPVNIGNPAIPGSVSSAGANAFDMTGSGTNLYGGADQFTFGYQQIAGDFDLRVRVQALNALEAWARAGLMARETLTTTSRFAATLAGPNISGASFFARLTGAAAVTSAGSYPVNYPQTWVRLQRSGNNFTGYASTDGQNWTLLGTANLASAAGTFFVGLAIFSANSSQVATAQLREFSSAIGGNVVPFAPTREPLGPSTRRTGLVFSEIMYHPKARPDGRQTEFVEIYNSMSIFEDISGYRLSGDVDYTFPNGTVLQPGAFLVLAKVAADVQSVYGISGVLQFGVTNVTTNILGTVTNIDNGLNQGGGNLRLLNRAGAVLLNAEYNNQYPWPIQADGVGHSLVLARPSYGENSRLAWDASDSIGGSPGTFDTILPEPARNVVINEFLAHTDLPAQDMIELYNHGNTPVDITGFYLSDSLNTNKYRITATTVLPPRGFIAFTESQLGFALSSSGEQIVLVNSNATRVIDAVAFDGQENGVSTGRYPDGAPSFRRLSAVTAGNTNAPPLASPVVINEIMYNPISGDGDDEFIEIYNRSGAPVNIGNWRFTSGIDYTFPPNTIMPAGAYFVVARSTARLLANNYGTLGSSNLFGNYDGNLNNGGERVALSAPDYDVNTNGSGQVITNISFRYVVNELTYGTGGRWSLWSDGDGSSLELIDPDSDNSQPANWADSDETQKSSWTSFENTGPIDWTQTGQGAGDTVHIFLLGVGECIVDDVEVRNGSNQLCLANSTFETGIVNWDVRGSHDQSVSDNNGFIGKGMRIRAGSRGDNGINRIRATLNPQILSGTATLRAKARWLRGFPEVLIRMHGGGIEAFGRLPVPKNLGTPGTINSRAVTNAGPAIYDVTHSPALPAANQPVRITARVNDPDGISSLVVRFRVDPLNTFTNVVMVDNGTGADDVAGDGLFSATVGGFNTGTTVAFHVQAIDGTGVTNLFPENALVREFPNDAPGHEALIRWGDTQMPGSFATYHLWMTAAVEQRWTSRDRLNNAGLDGTFVYNNYRVFYNVKPQYGGSPWHRGQMQGPVNLGVRVDYVLNFPDDDRLLGATDFVLNNAGNPGNGGANLVSDRAAMVEQLSYEIFKAINIHYNYRRYIHVFVNGNQRSITGNLPGNFIMEDSQQPNGDVIEQWFPDDTEGQLYKVEDWFEMSDDAGAHVNDDADLTRRTTTYNGVPTLDIAPYRFMWRKRSLGAGDSANNYSNLFTLIDAVSPSTNAGANPMTDVMVKQFGAIADFEQWMRIFAVQRTVGNWDAYGWERGKNGYAYRPERGKFEQMTWDIDFTMGVEGRDVNATIFQGTSDQRVQAMYNTPEIVRAYYRAFQDIVEGPLNLSYMNPLIEARTAAFRANNVTYDQSVIDGQIRPYITGRRTTLLNTLAGTASAFSIASTQFTTTSNIVTLTGTAPIGIKFIEINGINYAIAWTGSQTQPNTWTIRVPVSESGTNIFTLVTRDRNGVEIPANTRTIAVNYTGTIEQPQGTVVFNEVMFAPVVPDSEYVEIFNRSSTFTFDISGWRINGLDYTFPDGSVIGPRGFIVLTRDRVAFANAYGGNIQVFDQFPGQIQADGETLTLIKPGATPAQDIVVDKIRYEGALPWPLAANNTGSAVQLIDVNQDNHRVGNWFSGYVPAVYCCGSSTPAMTNDGWRFVSVFGNIGNGQGATGGVFRLVLFLGQELGTALVDDISLVAGTNAAVGSNYVRNGDFETPFYEEPLLTNSWQPGTNYSNSVIVSDLTHSGNGALKLIPTTFGNAIQITATATNNRVIYQALSPAPPMQSTNTLSFWFWATNSSTNLSVRIVNSGPLTITSTNINITITPSNYVPPQLVSAATNYLSPGTSNQNTAVLPAFQPLWINELQADNVGGIMDNAGEHEPWIELYNAGTNTVSLDGLYLATTYTNLTEWPFPAGHSLTGGQFLVIFCDAEPGETSGSVLHTSFRLPSGAGSIALSRIYNAQPQVLDYVNYGGIHADRSYGSYPDGQPFDRLEMFYVTAGGTNDGRSAPLNVFINEWMASNTNYIADPADNDYDDWFELYNPGTNAVDIAGYYLTDVLTDKTKYLITTNGPHIIPAGGFLLVWADNETGQNVSGGVPRQDRHVNFQLAQGGEAIGLFAADGTEIDSITFTQQVGNVSQGRFPNGAPSIYSMPTSQTPRASNFVPGTGNNPPTLTPIGPRSVYVNQTLTFQATANDVDAGQTLTFSLDVGAPLGASIDDDTGVFSWTPASVGTNVITVRVTDNGVPPMDDSESVVVRVFALPILTMPSLSGNTLSLTWFATAGRNYRVQYKNDLNDPTWTNLGQILTTENDAVLTITDDTSAQPHRFYQLIIVP
jgi:hypothetical protein